MNNFFSDSHNNYVIADLQYFGTISFIKKVVTKTNIIFDVSEPHHKRAFFNRAEIAGANGRIILSVPLVLGRNQKTPFNEVQISKEENWRTRHWRSIVSSYNASPWFTYYKDEMSALYEREFRLLKDWNLCCLTWIFEKLNVHPVLDMAMEGLDELAISGESIDLRKSRRHLQASGINDNPIRYRQVFQDKIGFLENLSIIDLLFCEGPKRTLELLQ